MDAKREVVLSDARSAYSKAFWRLMPLLFCCYLVSYLDRVNVGFAKLQMLDALHFDDAVYGLGAGIFFIGYFIFEVPSNMIMRKVGAGAWISRIMITWGIVSACMLLVQTPTQFYLARFALGVAEAGFVPGALYVLTLWFPAAERGRVLAVFAMGGPIAFVVGGPLSGWIMDAFKAAPPFQAWQWLFLIEAIPALVLGIIVFFVLKDDFRSVTWLTPAEKTKIEQDLRAENIRKVEFASVRAFLASPLLWVLILVYFCLILGLYALAFWLPTLIKRSGVLDLTSIGFYSALPNVVAALALYVSGRYADLTGRRRACFAAMLTLGALGLALAMAFSGGPAVTVLCLSVAAAGIFSSTCLFWALPSGVFMGASIAAAMAVINSLGNLGGFVSPYLVGWLSVATGRTDNGIYVICAVMVVGSAIALFLPRNVDDERTLPRGAPSRDLSDTGHAVTT